MAHNISFDTTAGRYSMMYVGQLPWHGVGKQLDHPATSAQAIEAAGLDWEVIKKPLLVDTPLAKQPLDGQYATMRKDHWERGEASCFGIVSNSYRPLQNRDAFTFFDDIVGQGEAIYHTAGSLGKGERIWILAKLPDTITIVGEDICDKYLLLSNSHDGKSSVQIKFTPIRVVCQNTLTLALSQGPRIRVMHTRNLHQRMREAEKLLGIVKNYYQKIDSSFKALARVNMDEPKLSEYLRQVFPDPEVNEEENESPWARVRLNREFAKHFFESGRGNDLPGVKGTLWAAYNGVTEYIDHRQLNQTDEQRLKSVWFGDGYSAKARAYRVAVEDLKTWAV